MFAPFSLIRYLKGLDTAAAGLVTGPIALLTIVVVRSVTGGGHHATVSGLWGLRIISALVVVLHRPIAIIDALLITVLIAAPAHLPTIRTLADADHAFGGGRRCEDIIDCWTTTGQQESRKDNNHPFQSKNGVSFHEGSQPVAGMM